MSNKSIGDRIKERRVELGMTLEDVGKLLGVNRSTVKRYEDGKTQRIAQKTIEKLAVILNTTTGNLLGLDTKAGANDLQLDGEVISLARDMQKLSKDNLSLLKSMVKKMSDIANEEKK